jgi:hypothetical protein
LGFDNGKSFSADGVNVFKSLPSNSCEGDNGEVLRTVGQVAVVLAR